jgi:hypothetical protein
LCPYLSTVGVSWEEDGGSRNQLSCQDLLEFLFFIFCIFSTRDIILSKQVSHHALPTEASWINASSKFPGRHRCTDAIRQGNRLPLEWFAVITAGVGGYICGEDPHA